ncbi:hypothetical protein [Daejeonella sp.]|uniref:hypothetical protein n=1 Tax=Daejeonella sp. TaxID=2805397 RepID=UPI0030BABA6D
MKEDLNYMLAQAIKSIEYRFIKSTISSKEGFGEFKISPQTRTPVEIMNHMFDLARKTKTMVTEGHFNVPAVEISGFSEERERLLNEIKVLTLVISESEIDLDIAKKLLQGPVMDMATHTGQIAMLNGIHGNKIPGESFYDVEM